MDERKASEAPRTDSRTSVERKSEREVIVRRVFDAPARIVFEAWTKPDLFMRWWAPKSIGIPMLSCQMDVRVGGTYRIEFGHDAASAMAFTGKYIDVAPPTRLVWTNEESEDGPVTTVTFEERDGKTHLAVLELYPSREALEAEQGGMLPEQFVQLDDLLVILLAEAAGRN